MSFLSLSEDMTQVNAGERFVDSRRAGMTLVETMMALLIFAICISGICKLVLMSREAGDRARDHYTAVSIAKSRLERMRVAAFGELATFAESDVIVDYAGSASANGHYQRTTTISDVMGTLKQATVAVGIRNRVTRRFDGSEEAATTYFVDLQTVP